MEGPVSTYPNFPDPTELFISIIDFIMKSHGNFQ